MKKFIFIVILIVSLTTQLFSEENELSNWCCDSIKVTSYKTDSCCIKIIVENPNCNSLKVEFSNYDENLNEYVQEYFPYLAQGKSSEYTFCRKENQSTISYRIRLSHDANYEPACGSYGDFTEGSTQFSGNYDVSNCCPCPTTRNNWVDMYVYKDRSCPNNGCKVLFGDIKIPEGLECYTGYSVEQVGFFQTQINDLLTQNLKGSSYCIDATTPSIFRIYLFKNGSTNYDSACVIEKFANCIGAFDPEDTMKMPCIPDCPNTNWSPKIIRTYYIVPSCSVRVTFVTRDGCPPINHQDLQILKIESFGYCFNLSQKEAYRLTVNEIIKENLMNFHPRIGEYGCFETWRIVNASCWKMNFLIDNDQKECLILEPCDTTNCCLSHYRVCRDTTENITIESLGTITEPQNNFCLYPEKAIFLKPYPPMYDMNCYAACDWLNIYVYDPIIGYNSILEVKENHKLLNKIFKECNEKQNCSYYLEIYNINGRLLNKYNLDPKNYQTENDLKMLFSEYKGLLLVKLFINNELKYVQKVIINN